MGLPQMTREQCRYGLRLGRQDKMINTNKMMPNGMFWLDPVRRYDPVSPKAIVMAMLLARCLGLIHCYRHHWVRRLFPATWRFPAFENGKE